MAETAKQRRRERKDQAQKAEWQWEREGRNTIKKFKADEISATEVYFSKNKNIYIYIYRFICFFSFPK